MDIIGRSDMLITLRSWRVKVCQCLVLCTERVLNDYESV